MDSNNIFFSNSTTEEEDVTHTLPFKVIGVAHTLETQLHLERCFNKMKTLGEVNVRISPEPNNEKDKNAISVQVDYGLNGWHHVGYIASELTDYVTEALLAGELLECRIEHIRFRVTWLRPGFYMKLLLTKKKAWHNRVIQTSHSVQ